MRRMERIRGRTDDMMIVRGVNVFPTQIEEIVLKTPGLTTHFLCVLSRPNRMDEMTVRVEAAPGAASAAPRAQLGDQLVARVKQALGVTVDLDVVEPGSLERSLGKAKRILDLRPGPGIPPVPPSFCAPALLTAVGGTQTFRLSPWGVGKAETKWTAPAVEGPARVRPGSPPPPAFGPVPLRGPAPVGHWRRRLSTRAVRARLTGCGQWLGRRRISRQAAPLAHRSVPPLGGWPRSRGHPV